MTCPVVALYIQSMTTVYDRLTKQLLKTYLPYNQNHLPTTCDICLSATVTTSHQTTCNTDWHRSRWRHSRSRPCQSLQSHSTDYQWTPADHQRAYIQHIFSQQSGNIWYSIDRSFVIAGRGPAYYGPPALRPYVGPVRQPRRGGELVSVCHVLTTCSIKKGLSVVLNRN